MTRTSLDGLVATVENPSSIYATAHAQGHRARGRLFEKHHFSRITRRPSGAGSHARADSENRGQARLSTERGAVAADGATALDPHETTPGDHRAREFKSRCRRVPDASDHPYLNSRARWSP